MGSFEAKKTESKISRLGTFNYFSRGTRHTSTALYFYGASKKSLHKPKATFGNMLFQINYGIIYYLQLLYLQFLPKTHLNFKKSLLALK
jgi:hypothetical protein